MKTSFFLCFMSVLITLSISPTHANVITVGPAGTSDHTIIQHAVDEAVEGDSIFVSEGNYFENILIDSSKSDMTLMGGFNPSDWTRDIEANPTIITGAEPGEFSCIRIQKSSNITISGFWLTNSERIIMVYPATNVLIEHNYIHDATGYNYTSGINVESIRDFKTENITIRNNVIWNIIGSGSRGGGIDVTIHQPYKTHNIRILNNTIYNVSQDGILMGRVNAFVNNAVVKNNIVMNARDTGIQFKDIQYGVSDYNCLYGNGENYYGESTIFEGGFHDVTDNPLFVSEENNDFHLQADSPCIDSGAPDPDNDGISWETDPDDQDPDGSRMDIGALYYNALLENQILVTIGTQHVIPGATVVVPVYVSFPSQSTVNSAEILLGGYSGLLGFVKVDTTNSLSGSAGWSFQAMETDSSLKIAFEGSKDISGHGLFFGLIFSIPETATGFIPLLLKSATFLPANDPVALKSGGLYIPVYGDLNSDGLVLADDASLLLKYLVNDVTPGQAQLNGADVTLDTTISSLDAALILQYAEGLIDSLPYKANNDLFQASGHVNMEEYQIQNDQSILVILDVEDGVNILGFDGLISFDPDNLDYVGISWAEQVDHFQIETNPGLGQIQFAGAGSLPVDRDGVFAILQFKMKKDFDSDQAVTLEQFRWNEGPVKKDVSKTILPITTGTDNFSSATPTTFSLAQNYPNPFNASTRINYNVPTSEHVTISIYNMSGQLIETLVNGFQHAGRHSLTWDAGRLSSGLYIYKITAGKYSAIRKCSVLK